ncbi:gluconeogenesis factor [bacterium BMS3Bbin14]|nr:gluconeogenesis factor [bacterium BMS3Bbin14]
MERDSEKEVFTKVLATLAGQNLSLLDFLPDGSLAEKMISLVLNGPPPSPSSRLTNLFQEFMPQFFDVDTRDLKVVIFGGGTGLSNIIGGDSRQADWCAAPFTGLKEIFPQINSIVCVTDDGGSSGELLKELPLVALGDLRHVLLSSIRREKIKERYGLDDSGAVRLAGQLHAIFNYRFTGRPGSGDEMLAAAGLGPGRLPAALDLFLRELAGRLFADRRLAPTLDRPQCLGNLLLASAIYEHLDPAASHTELAADDEAIDEATIRGLAALSSRLGAPARAVLPCTTTSAQLQILYGNGVLATGEYKSGHARRGYPVDRVIVRFFRPPRLPPLVRQVIGEADIIIFAPGSLYSSVVPILQIPGLAETVRANDRALKLLIANIWVQKGETDAARDAPERKFHVSDLIRAYARNIPGGVGQLFSHVLALGLGDIPGSVLRNYALEDKEPIYLDRQPLREMGFEPVEACIFSKEMLSRRRVIQHDPDALAMSIRTLWNLNAHGLLAPNPRGTTIPGPGETSPLVRDDLALPCQRYHSIRAWLRGLTWQQVTGRAGLTQSLPGDERLRLFERVAEVIWHHHDILLQHLQFVQGIILVDSARWRRCQQWDNVFSFYDPLNGCITIRRDQLENHGHFEMAFLVALGESLLGNYAREKRMADVHAEGESIGRVFRLTLREPRDCNSFLVGDELKTYLQLARMRVSQNNPLLYTRLVNGEEGFTPPGLLFGLFYAWYLDNRFAGHIEYKMSILRDKVSDLIPEQVRIVGRRNGLTRFFRETVFRHRLKS